MSTVHGQDGWGIKCGTVRGHLTRIGGQLGPVAFRLGRTWVQPYSVAPWVEDERLAADTPNILRVLRGDFFCCPFGTNAALWRGERHPVHGETANNAWRLEGVSHADGRTTLRASLATSIRSGRVDKEITVVEGQAALYVKHVLSGMRGPMNLGHHAMIKFPETPGSGVVSLSPFVRGQVFPEAFEKPEGYGYQSLKPAALFRSLEHVPLNAGGYADLTRYPARKGFEDLVMVTADPKLPFAWSAVTFPGERYAWFALRDPRVLRHTVLWISNGGRHYPPWSGRHTGVMGIEDVTAYFHYGLAESAKPNPVSRAGFPTTLQLSLKIPTEIPYIMAAAPIPPGFERIARIEPERGGVRLVSPKGKSAKCRMDLAFLIRR